MKREWKPGDVAAVDGFSGGPDVALVRTARIGKGARLEFAYANGGFDLVDDFAEGFAARPLVVIDPEDREQVERLVAALEAVPVDYSDGGDANELQAALRSLVTPPKPDEPQGLGAVVEDADGERYVRHGLADDPDGEVTWCNSIGVGRSWARINGARILSEGVQP